MSEILPENPSPIAPETSEIVPKKSQKRRFLRWVFRFLTRAFVNILILFFILCCIIQLPSVQKWGIEKTTAYLSDELHTTVKIDNFKLDFFDEISIGGLFVANKNAPTDTLAYIGTLRADVSYWHLVWGIVQLDAVRLENTTIRLKRNVGEYDNNLQFIIDYFDPPKAGPPSPKKPADIRIGQVHLRSIDFLNDDKVSGQRMTLRLKAADLHTNIMNLPNHLLDVTRINLFEPYFHVEDFESQPLPPRPKAQFTSLNENVPPKPLSINAQKAEIEKPFQFLIGAISIENGNFLLDNWFKSPKKTTSDSTLDFRHLTVGSMNVNIHNFMFYKDEFTGVVDGISLKSKSGFVLNKLIVGDAKISPQLTELYGLQIETPNSIVGDTLRLIYPDGYTAFKDFENKVTLDARIHSGKVAMNDIMTFAVALQDNPFFIRNRNESAKLEVRAFGKINSLKLPAFDIQLGRGFHAAGKLESRDLTNKNETFINLDLNQLQTSMASLQQLIPDFKPTPAFNRLGNLDFKGKFLGFFTDFTANGRLNSELGSAVMDIKLAPATDDANVATYSGNIALDKFDLGAFAQNPDFGKVTLKTSILRGRGFTKENVNVNLVAVLDNFTFKNYEYKNVNLTGDLNKNLFSGKLESKDANADLLFDGTVDFANATPIFKFKTDINRIDLKSLNLIKDDFAVSGKLLMDISGSKLSNLTGTVDLKNLILFKDKTQQFRIDSLMVSSVQDAQNGKHFKVNSDILTAQIDGNFDIETIHEPIIRHLVKNHPRLAADIGLKSPFVMFDPLSILPNFKYNINILNSKSLTKLFDNKLDTLKNIEIKGSIDELNNRMDFDIYTEETHHYDDIKIVAFELNGKGEGIDLDWNLKTYNVVIGNKQDFKDIYFQNHVTGDTVEFGLTSHNFSQALKMDTVELNALLMRQDSFYKLSFGTSQLSRIKVFGDYWDIDRQNFILLGKNSINVKGFDLRNRDREITLQSCESRGLSAHLNNFDVAFVNPFVNDDRFTFGGKYSVNIEFEDIFNQTNFKATLALDTFLIKGVNRGSLRINAMGEDFKKPIFANVLIQNGDQKATIDGYYYPSVFTAKTGVIEANSIDFSLDLQTFPIKTLELLIENGVSRWQGNVSGGLRVSGPLKRLDYNGSLRVQDVGVTVDYLKCRLYVRDETVKITNAMFDATGCAIYDSLGHKAIVKGGLTHNRFLDFGLKASVKADTFIFLNTTRENNPLYYGLGVGKGEVTFGGDFKRTEIKIKARADKGTNITFPFATEATANETGFVVFKSRKYTEGSDTTAVKVNELRGVNLDMELSVTPQAEVKLIFDETADDNIQAKGSGDFHLTFNRTGEARMDGEYVIAEGNYLFTLLKVVQKNFTIKPGGSIRWNGSPFDATLNIEAQYKNLTAAPYNFVAEYVENDIAAKQDSRKPTPIDLTLKLSGALQRPDINFDLGFSRLTSNLKSYTESKLRLLRQDQNELNRQVFGLVVVGGFLPSDIGNQQLRSSTINTALESASNIVSSLFNRLIGEYVSGVDVEIGYNIFENVIDPSNPTRNSSGQQFHGRVNYNLNDRFVVGGGLGVESGEYLQQSLGTNIFVGGDFLLDYYFSDDRRLKLRISYTFDQVFEGRRNKPAAGIRFRQEFDTLEEFIKSLKSKR